MFVFGIVRSPSPTYDRIARPALESVMEADSRIILREGSASISASYNSILDECGERFPEVEAVVLMHQDVEITGSDFFSEIRDCLRDPTVGLIGTVGAVGVRSLVYWRASPRGYVREAETVRDFGAVRSDVDVVDGMLLALSPPVASRLRFDESVSQGFHGYDIDLGFAVRAAGLRVVVRPLPVIHHTKGGFGDRRAYLRSSRAWRRKWLADAPLRTKLASWNDELQVASRRDVIGVRSFLRRQLQGRH